MSSVSSPLGLSYGPRDEGEGGKGEEKEKQSAPRMEAPVEGPLVPVKSEERKRCYAETVLEDGYWQD